MTKFAFLVPLAAIAFALGGCEMNNGDHHAGGPMEHRHESMWAHVNNAVAFVAPTENNWTTGVLISGTIYFDPAPAIAEKSALHVHGTFKGLKPNSTHAVHIHEFGDQTSVDGTAAGSHYDPEGTHHHGSPTTAEPHHPGDLGNITADASGNATLDVTISDVSIAGPKNPILGRSVVLHEKADDFGQPVGNAGGRIGVGVIGVAKPK